MATDLTLNNRMFNEDKRKDSGIACGSAPYCCWYETVGENSRVCTNRTDLVCQLRREEVFRAEAESSGFDGKAAAGAGR
ncbi:MAG: hypothetical protein LBG06_09480 [Deltaproteobacteria bacterium]|jgi:hypothetical protein|nr:hypothetical protein [Deltaproteobacteria bacterium]